jgi:hypothetical protein
LICRKWPIFYLAKVTVVWPARRRDEEGKICLGYPRMGLADVRIALSGKQEDVVLWFKQTKIRTIEGEE